MAGVLLALSATVASAAGVNLAWTNCRGSGGVTANTNLCGTTGARSMYASFNPPAGLTQLEGEEVYIKYQESVGPAGPVSCWWNYSTAPSAADLVGLPNPPVDANGVPTIACANFYFQGKPGLTGAAQGQAPSGNQGEIQAILAFQAGQGAAPTAGDTYAFGFQFKNSARNTTCTGCSNGVTLTLYRISLTSSVDPRQELTNADIGNVITYNGGFSKIESRTWGAVKALYRR